MKRLRYLLLSAMLGLIHPLLAQTTDGPDFFDSIGKINVVVAVIVVIFVGLALYLFRIDRKVSQLENILEDE